MKENPEGVQCLEREGGAAKEEAGRQPGVPPPQRGLQFANERRAGTSRGEACGLCEVRLHLPRNLTGEFPLMTRLSAGTALIVCEARSLCHQLDEVGAVFDFHFQIRKLRFRDIYGLALVYGLKGLEI